MVSHDVYIASEQITSSIVCDTVCARAGFGSGLRLSIVRYQTLLFEGLVQDETPFLTYNSFIFVLQMLREYEKRAKQLEEQVDTFRRLRDMEGKVQQLEMELQWALVIEIEKVGQIPVCI